MKSDFQTTAEQGFTLVELMISLLILMVVIGAVVNLFSVAINQHESEQTSIESNQDARSGLELMTQEIAQAGSHRGTHTYPTAGITGGISEQTVTVKSTNGFMTGDYVDLGDASSSESVKLTAVGTSTFTGIFFGTRAATDPIRLYAQPFQNGVIPPAGLAANSSTAATTLKIFGDINSDGKINYAEYVYDIPNSEITRSITDITQATINPAIPIIRDVHSAQFRLITDGMGVVTSVEVSLTVRNTWRQSGKLQEAQLSSKILIPSAIAASALLNETRALGSLNKLPPTPPKVTTWANR